MTVSPLGGAFMHFVLPRALPLRSFVIMRVGGGLQG